MPDPVNPWSVPATLAEGTAMEQVRLELARTAYLSGKFRLADPDLTGFTHLMASRQGLYALRRGAVRLVAHGLFFGLATTPDGAYVFESGELARHGGAMGRIVRLDIADGRVTGWRVLAQGLSSGCHQLDLIDARVCVVDTQNQCIRWISEDGAERGTHAPLPPAAADDWAGGYAHVNSLLATRDAILLLLHMGGKATGRSSELAVLDRAWRLQDRLPLPGEGCHNLALTADGTLVTCASLSGELVALDGRRARLSSMMTRGLAVGPEGLVVGASAFSNRSQRHEAMGEVLFTDPDWVVVERMAVPAAPTDIRCLYGPDLGQSAWTGGIAVRLGG